MNIFLAKDGKPDGPYSVEQIREMVHAKQISMTDQVWEEGSSDWKRICDSTELAVKIVPTLHQSHSQTPPPVPTCQLSATPAIASSNVRAQSQPEALPLHLETWGGLLGSTVNMGLDGELKNDTFTFRACLKIHFHRGVKPAGEAGCVSWR